MREKVHASIIPAPSFAFEHPAFDRPSHSGSQGNTPETLKPFYNFLRNPPHRWPWGALRAAPIHTRPCGTGSPLFSVFGRRVAFYRPVFRSLYMNKPYPTWLEIQRSTITNNCANIIRDINTPLMAIVKGEAYGHGAVAVAQAAIAGGAQWLGVARFCEARSLRQNNIQAPILVLGMLTAAEVDEAIASNVTLTLHSPETLDLFAARARAAGQPVQVHLKVDTGMGRLGVFAEELLPFVRQAQAAGGFILDGLYSHLAMADDAHPANEKQIERFQKAVNSLQGNNLRPRWVHLANSAAAFYLPQTRYDLARVGNVVLGLRIRIDQPLPEYYRPALSWKAQLASCRNLPPGWGVGYGQSYTALGNEIIGVVPAGYGDGLRRVSGNQVIIGGQKCPVVGRLCLDQMMVRLPRQYPLGEEVVIIGRQGHESIGVHELAALYKTTQVDFTTLIHSRVPRISV
jgi:alanine racemase